MSDRPISEQTSTDDELSALLDGEISADAERQLRLRLERDPALAARLDALEHANAVVRDAYAHVSDERVPQHLADLLRTSAHETRPDNVVPLARRERYDGGVPTAVPAALAASVALVVGIALGLVLGPRVIGPEAARLVADAGRVDGGSALYDALQTLPSAASREIAAGLTATARLSFATNDGAYCRQLELAGARGTTATLACRRGDVWQVEAATFAAQAASATDGAYRPAAGNASALDAAIDELIAGEPLGTAAEAALIERGWAQAAPP
jgi:anti-sigma factor RsiW